MGFVISFFNLCCGLDFKESNSLNAEDGLFQMLKLSNTIINPLEIQVTMHALISKKRVTRILEVVRVVHTHYRAY